MKLKIECVKDILEELEGLPIGAHSLGVFQKSIDKYGQEDVLYTVVKLSEAKYINGDLHPLTSLFWWVIYNHLCGEKNRASFSIAQRKQGG